MRVLVTGSRQFLDQGPIYEALDAALLAFAAGRHFASEFEGDDFVVIHGAAPGADTIASQWCWDRGRELAGMPIKQEAYPADWSRGRLAGKQRNFEMVQLGADLVLAFFQPGAGNTGTRHCVETARRFLEFKGTEIKEIWNT